MISDKAKCKPNHLISALVALLCLSTLLGCGPAATPVLAPVETQVETPTLTGPELDGTKIVAGEAPQHAWETRVANGTPFAYTPIVLTPVPPVWTPELGITGACASASHIVDYEGCWGGIINNEYVFVSTGAPMSDLTQGVINVSTTTLDLRPTGPKQEYMTPSKDGPVRPSQVVWPLMTLAVVGSDPPITYTFDLSTRQWVSSPTPVPLVSPSVSVVPTTSPAP